MFCHGVLRGCFVFFSRSQVTGWAVVMRIVLVVLSRGGMAFGIFVFIVVYKTGGGRAILLGHGWFIARGFVTRGHERRAHPTGAYIPAR